MKLVAAATTAFVDAVGHMTRLPSKLRYTWIHFARFNLDSNDLLSSHLFRGLPSIVTNALRKADILESQDGQYKKPSNMVYIPNEYRDRAGRPLIAIEGTHHLSKKYASDANSNLILTTTLGVQGMDPAKFRKTVIKRLDGRLSHKAFYKNKDEQWHSDFCKAFNKLDSSFWVREAPDLYIVPLSNGKWIRPSDQFVFLPPVDKDKEVQVPQGINITIADEGAMRDKHRRATCHQAGLRQLTNDAITKLIIDSHHLAAKTPKNFKPTSLSSLALASQALFLFDTDWRRNGPGLYMASSLGGCRLGENMYFQSNMPGSASRVLLPGPQQTYGFLHSCYSTAAGENAVRKEEWHKFLSRELGVETFPRLCNRHKQNDYKLAEHKRFLHPDFAVLLNTHTTIEWLTVLRDGWEHYRQYLEKPSEQTRAPGNYHNALYDAAVRRDALVYHFRTFPVPRKGSRSSMMLRDGYQPTRRLVHEYGELAPLIDLPDPDHTNWSPLLDSLLIPKTPSIVFYAECLRSARLAGDDATVDTFRRLMTKMDALKGSDTPPVNRKLVSRAAAETYARQNGDTLFQ